MTIEVHVAGLALDEKTRSPIVVLKDETGNKVLPIVIGIMEASAIAAQLEGVDFPRPMTHDLLAAIIKKLGAVLESVEISALINDTFYASLHLRRGKKVWTIDARPSDSIALALRLSATITVSEEVLEQSSQKHPINLEDDDTWKQVLENLDDDEFGKYKM